MLKLLSLVLLFGAPVSIQAAPNTAPAIPYAGQNVVTASCQDLRELAEVVMAVRQQYDGLEADATKGAVPAAEIFRDAYQFARYESEAAQKVLIAEFGERYYSACREVSQ